MPEPTRMQVPFSLSFRLEGDCWYCYLQSKTNPEIMLARLPLPPQPDLSPDVPRKGRLWQK